MHLHLPTYFYQTNDDHNIKTIISTHLTLLIIVYVSRNVGGCMSRLRIITDYPPLVDTFPHACLPTDLTLR